MSQSKIELKDGMRVAAFFNEEADGYRTILRVDGEWQARSDNGVLALRGEGYIRQFITDGIYRPVVEASKVFVGVDRVDPTEAQKRKTFPLATGCVDYFPDALLAVAELSRIGNEQHNPGKLLHWDRAKSTDEADALMRHFVDRGKLDTDGVRHSAKVAWRALALLQKEIEKDREGTGGEEHF
jgi:hypothetical protein